MTAIQQALKGPAHGLSTLEIRERLDTCAFDSLFTAFLICNHPKTKSLPRIYSQGRDIWSTSLQSMNMHMLMPPSPSRRFKQIRQLRSNSRVFAIIIETNQHPPLKMMNKNLG